jgi:FkbM family methyltransferase
MIERLLKLIKRNKTAYSLGLPFFTGIGKFKMPNKVTYRGSTFPIHFPELDLATANLVFIELFLDDCYRLTLIKEPIKKIIDIGANMGFASLKMTILFNPDSIIAFEPNPFLIPFIKKNLSHLNTAIIENKAIGHHDGTANLIFIERENQIVSGLTKTDFEQEGNTEIISFNSVVKKYGPIDLVKMDCEGAEWGFLQDEAWQGVKYLTMEYHLNLDNPKKQKANLIELLNAHFKILADDPIDELTGIILAKNKFI